jgi:hypothetical protein
MARTKVSLRAFEELGQLFISNVISKFGQSIGIVLFYFKYWLQKWQSFVG